MNLILLGPQGSGKGTQAEILVQKYGLNYFEAGKILRGLPEIKEILNHGELVPEDLVRKIASDFVKNSDRTKGFLFDGYPRSLEQYQMLKEILAESGLRLDLVVNIEIPQEESIKRLSARRMCANCGEIYNLVTDDRPTGDKCSKCGGELIQREDDQPEAVLRRLEIYKIRTHPVFEKALEEGIGEVLDGSRSILEISQDLERIINEKVER